LTPSFDVLFLDPATVYDGEQGHAGGTEQQVARIATALAKYRKKVAVWNGRKDETLSQGVTYAPYQTPAEATNLIALRGAPIYPHLKSRRVIEWTHDAQAFKTHHPVLCVSKWQKNEVWKDPDAKVILPMLPDDLPKHAPIKGRYIYASAACKGLQATLDLWASMYHPPERNLFVTNPGYDAHKIPKRLPKNVYLLGVLPTVHDVANEMAQCEGLFFVNTFPECAPVTPALAEAIGLRAHVLSKEPCGLTEMVTGGYLTSDAGKFIREFEEPPVYPPPTKKYGTVEQWLRLLGAT
jgi:hypothetical protein